MVAGHRSCMPLRVVKILLGREEVNPDNLDIFGDTPLMHTARECHRRVVELLVSPSSNTQCDLKPRTYHLVKITPFSASRSTFLMGVVRGHRPLQAKEIP